MLIDGVEWLTVAELSKLTGLVARKIREKAGLIPGADHAKNAKNRSIWVFPPSAEQFVKDLASTGSAPEPEKKEEPAKKPDPPKAPEGKDPKKEKTGTSGASSIDECNGESSGGWGVALLAGLGLLILWVLGNRNR